jgi:hypothetical protein
LDEAWAVTRETVRRVRFNLELIYRRLQGLGYRFADPEQAFRVPDANDAVLLGVIEDEHGPLPLVMRAWYETVGSVDFSQEESQLTEPDGTGLTGFGFLNPLVVKGLHYLWENRQQREAEDVGEPFMFFPTGSCASNNEPTGFAAPRLSADDDEYDGEGGGFVPHVRYVLLQGGVGRSGGLLKGHEMLVGLMQMYLKGGPLPDVGRVSPILCAGLEPM